MTLGAFERLAELPEGADVYSFLSVLLNLSPLEVMNLPAAFVNEQVLAVLDFEGFTLPPSILMPTTFGQTQLPVLKSLDLVSFGQATDMGALLQDTACAAEAAAGPSHRFLPGLLSRRLR